MKSFRKIFLFLIAINLLIGENIFAEDQKTKKESFIFAQVDMDETNRISDFFDEEKLEESDLTFARILTKKRVVGSYEATQKNDGEQYNKLKKILVIENENIIDSSMIEKIECTYGYYSTVRIDIVFTEIGKQILADYTVEHVGDYIAIILNDNAIVNACIRSPIPGGQLSLEGLTKDEAVEFCETVKDSVEYVDYSKLSEPYEESNFYQENLYQKNYNVYKLNFEYTYYLSHLAYIAMVNGEEFPDCFDLEDMFSGFYNVLINGYMIYVYEKENILSLDDYKKIYFLETDVDVYGVIIKLSESGIQKIKNVFADVESESDNYFFISYNDTGFVIEADKKNPSELLINYMSEDVAEFVAKDLKDAIKK